MRDLDRWKDKVELSLDGRQIFFLFFGTAVAACLVFVLGVLVGKRLEARALALQPAPVEDPLAALDQLGDADEADEGLTFHKALTRDAAHKPAKAEAKPEPKVDPKVDPKTEAQRGNEDKTDEKPADKPPVDAPKAETQTIVAQKPINITAPVAPKPDAAGSSMPGKLLASAAHTPVPPAAPAKAAPLPPGKPQVVAAAAPKKPDAPGAKKPDPTASHFTLQLSAFPEKSDAEEFMHKIQSAGYKPFLVASEVPGKGVFYRVRVGDYGTRQAAVDAKADFERKQRMIAYVAKL
jgi:cell division septation protein DedD